MGRVVSIITLIWFHKILLGLVIAIAIIVNLTMAGLIGSLIPLLIKKFGGDPAIASPLLLTTATAKSLTHVNNNIVDADFKGVTEDNR